MRTANFPLQTLKEVPADAEIASHRLMLRAGLIRKLAAGHEYEGIDSGAVDFSALPGE